MVSQRNTVKYCQEILLGKRTEERVKDCRKYHASQAVKACAADFHSDRISASRRKHSSETGVLSYFWYVKKPPALL